MIDGSKGRAVAVRFNGLDEQVIPEAPDFMKSLDVDHARDGEVMIAYAMNSEQLPLLNGFPLRLIVPGLLHFTYWVKMLNDIEVLGKPDDNFWMAKAYLIPDTPFASVKPGQTGVKLVPINRMIPRLFITNLKSWRPSTGRRAALTARVGFGRRHRRQQSGYFRGPRCHMAADGTWKGRGKVWISPLASIVYAASRRSGCDGPLHQRQR